jgi:protein-disulfide isomerase
MRRCASSIAAMSIGCSVAAADSAVSDAEFGEKVRAYLLENPTVILEVMDLLAAQQEDIATRALLSPYVVQLFGTEMDLRMGAPDASRVIVEFFDYNCAVCKANMPAMTAFVAANPDVAIVKKHLPILTPGSERVVRFVLAARKAFGPAIYADLHDAIYAQFGPLNMNRLEAVAVDADLDPAKITALMQDDDITAIIDQHRTIAIGLGIIGTPTFATESSLHVGAVTPHVLMDLLDGA